MTDLRPFICGKVVIDSLRDNGYKNAAYAIAEIVDNSIQAKADIVRVICYERISKSSNQRALKLINKIGILDNGTGMSADTLYKALEFGASENKKDKIGMGKFGMGLPNSSISQCTRVEVWSWKNTNEIYYTYLDINEMKSGRLETIPQPKTNVIPDNILATLGDKLSASGTLVLWSDLDRLQWKTSASIYKHSEVLIGRMYRYYLQNGDATIWFDRYLEENDIYKPEDNPKKFKANDPLYLLKNTSLPELPVPYENEPFFNLEKEEVVKIDFDGAIHEVIIKGSIVNPSIFKKIRDVTKRRPGGTVWGKHAAANYGVSVVRSNRELELKDGGFFITELRDKGRFIAIEVSFPPALDVVFGVLNNKQSAVNFYNIQKDEEAEREGLTVGQYEEDLKFNNDPKIHLFKVINMVSLVIESLRKPLNLLDFSNYSDEGEGGSAGSEIENAATEADSHRAETNPIPEDDEVPTLEDIKAVIEQGHGNVDRDTLPSPEEILKSGLRYKIEELAFDSSAFFDATSQNGFTLVQINKNHPFYNKIIHEVGEEQQGMLELALAAWSRMEAESSSNARAQYQNARRRWGEVLTDFLSLDGC
ncbi:MAG: ATP-binding protein [Chlorobi bacterium]|nr:ATP-binding protein [Chlorobiota bacterium]